MDASTATSGPTWTLPGIDALGPTTGELAGFGLFDDDDAHEPSPGPVETPTAASPMAPRAEATPDVTEADETPWTLPNRPAWDRPDNAVWEGPEPIGAAPTIPTSATAPVVAPAAFAEPFSEPTAEPALASAHSPLPAATDARPAPTATWPAPAAAWPAAAPSASPAPSEQAVASPATLADVVAAVRGREHAPWAAPAEPTVTEHPSSGFLLDDVITSTAFPRAEHVTVPHVAHELAPREHHAPLESVLRTHAPDAAELGSPVASPAVPEDFDADAFAAALHVPEAVDEETPAAGRFGRRAAKAPKAERAPKREKAGKADKTRGEAGKATSEAESKDEPWAKASKERSPRRGRKAEQAALFERMTAPRPGTAVPTTVTVEGAPAADQLVDDLVDDPFVVDHVAAAPAPRRDEPSRGRKGRTTAKPTAPRGRLGRRRTEEPDMLDRLQGRFPAADPATAPDPVIGTPADSLGLRGSPTLDHPASEHPTLDGHAHGNADGLEGTSWAIDERWGAEADDERRGIFAKRPARSEEPLSGGKALALRLLAVLCIAGGLFVGWRTLHAPSTDETPAPTPTTVATMPAATVVAEVPTTVAMADATVDPNAVTDPNAMVDPNAVTDPNAMVDPNAAVTDPSAGSGDFFEPPKDYSAR